jgi:hypothetical protein
MRLKTYTYKGSNNVISLWQISLPSAVNSSYVTFGHGTSLKYALSDLLRVVKSGADVEVTELTTFLFDSAEFDENYLNSAL